MVLPLGFIILVVWGLYRASQGHDDPMEPKTTPKEFFMQLFAFGTLYIAALSLGSLLFAYIDRLFPDALNNYGYYPQGLEQVRWPMAALIVLFPVFLILSRIINNALVADPQKKEARVYKWLVYLTLTIASATVIIDLITLIYNFLGGDLTTRFVLKVLVVLAIALAAFGYYLWHLKTDLALASTKRKVLLVVSSLAVIVSIVAGFFILGSPVNQRKIRFDQQRVNSLQSIESSVNNYWQLHERLPATIGELGPQGKYIALDPETNQAYEYSPLGVKNFRVCATFDTKINQSMNQVTYPSGETWDHPAGHYCFDRTVYADPIRPQPVLLKD